MMTCNAVNNGPRLAHLRDSQRPLGGRWNSADQEQAWPWRCSWAFFCSQRSWIRQQMILEEIPTLFYFFKILSSLPNFVSQLQVSVGERKAGLSIKFLAGGRKETFWMDHATDLPRFAGLEREGEGLSKSWNENCPFFPLSWNICGPPRPVFLAFILWITNEPFLSFLHCFQKKFGGNSEVFLLETKIGGTSSAFLIEYHSSNFYIFFCIRSLQAPRTMNPLWPGGTSPTDPVPPTPPPALRPLRTTTPVPTSPNPLRRFYQRFGDEEGVQADQVIYKNKNRLCSKACGWILSKLNL